MVFVNSVFMGLFQWPRFLEVSLSIAGAGLEPEASGL